MNYKNYMSYCIREKLIWLFYVLKGNVKRFYCYDYYQTQWSIATYTNSQTHRHTKKQQNNQ